MSVQKIDLTNPLLLEAAQALAPGRLRVGGSEVGLVVKSSRRSWLKFPNLLVFCIKGDKVFYDVDGEGCDKWSPQPPVNPDFCLNMTRWGQILDFGATTGIGIVFGLNAMTRANNSAPANLSNHEAFMAFTAQVGWVSDGGWGPGFFCIWPFSSSSSSSAVIFTACVPASSPS